MYPERFYILILTLKTQCLIRIEIKILFNTFYKKLNCKIQFTLLYDETFVLLLVFKFTRITFIETKKIILQNVKRTVKMGSVTSTIKVTPGKTRRNKQNKKKN